LIKEKAVSIKAAASIKVTPVKVVLKAAVEAVASKVAVTKVAASPMTAINQMVIEK